MKNDRVSSITRLVVLLLLAAACGSSDSETSLDSPGDACDGSRPIVCGSVAQGGSSRDVILFCKDGAYQSVKSCEPTNGQTNRCFGGASSTLADCFDEPDAAFVTRCEVRGSGTSTTYRCAVGRK